MVFTNGNNDTWPIFGFGLGLWLFYRGLRLYRRALLVADIPSVPIRSMAMGVVQVHGVAKGSGTFPSPVSGTPCYAYKVQIERWRNEGNHSGWSHYRTDVNGKAFYLEDATGRVKVNPRGAEFDLPKNCRREAPESMMGSMFSKEIEPPLVDAGMGADSLPVPRTEDDLLTYAEGIGSTGSHRYRFTEYCILPGYDYDVLGTCTENPHPDDANDHNLIVQGRDEDTYLISSKPEGQLERSLWWKSAAMVWGGVGLAVVCAMALLVRFGLLSF